MSTDVGGTGTWYPRTWGRASLVPTGVQGREGGRLGVHIRGGERLWSPRTRGRARRGRRGSQKPLVSTSLVSTHLVSTDVGEGVSGIHGQVRGQGEATAAHRSHWLRFLVSTDVGEGKEMRYLMSTDKMEEQAAL